MILDRAAFLERRDLPREKVPVPELGEGAYVYVRAMSAAERDRLEHGHKAADKAHLRARFAAATVCDEQGKNLFAEADVPELAALNCAPLDRIFDAALKLSRYRDEDVAELEGNS